MRQQIPKVARRATNNAIRGFMEVAGIEVEETETIAELRDIADVLSITANTDSNIKKSMEAILRIVDRLERKNKNVG